MNSFGDNSVEDEKFNLEMPTTSTIDIMYVHSAHSLPPIPPHPPPQTPQQVHVLALRHGHRVEHLAARDRP